jgi:hypothetical protein
MAQRLGSHSCRQDTMVMRTGLLMPSRLVNRHADRPMVKQASWTEVGPNRKGGECVVGYGLGCARTVVQPMAMLSEEIMANLSL